MLLKTYLKDRVTQREGERDVLHLLVHSPNGYNNQGEVRPKPGAWNSIQVSNMGGRGPGIWAIIHDFPGAAWTQTASICVAGITAALQCQLQDLLIRKEHTRLADQKRSDVFCGN